jgi:hypothetical protein
MSLCTGLASRLAKAAVVSSVVCSSVYMHVVSVSCTVYLMPLVWTVGKRGYSNEICEVVCLDFSG